MRQVSALVFRINRRQHNEYALEAGLHGIKIPAFSTGSSVPEVSEEATLAFDKAMKSAQQRKMQEMRDRNGRQ